jgi:lipopolysaccharide export system protein LptA
MRTLVLVAAVVLLAALTVFLAVGKWKNPFNRRDLPNRLGIEVQQESSGVTYTQAHGGHTLFKLHASKVVQLKEGNHVLLHKVKIELYGADGTRVDRIEGDEFEYDPEKNLATAAGPVEITLMRPGVAPAIAPKATARQALSGKAKGSTLASAAETAERGEIHVKTSGLSFDEKSGVATTDRHVDFSVVQGSGSSMGARYDSQPGHLVLDRAVELTTVRGGKTVVIHAQHGEFERGDKICHLHAATADYKGGEATAGDAKVLFREDGSAVRLDAMNGFTLTTATGAHVTAPTGSMDFNEHNQPRHGHLEGGVRLDSTSQKGSRSRQLHGSSPVAELEFTLQGELRHVHLERGVEMHSEDVSETQDGSGPLRESRTWVSPVADVDFRDNGKGQAEPATIHGTQGVVVTGESQRGTGAVAPFRLAADEMTGELEQASHSTNKDAFIGAQGTELRAMNGVGHASVEETTATGARQTATGDRLEAHFVPAGGSGAKSGQKSSARGLSQVQSAFLDGHVVLIQTPVAKPGAQAEAPLRATAGRAVYEGVGEWLHLTLSPRVENGGFELTAEKVDVSHDSGDAFAHGNVKATWVDSGQQDRGTNGASSLSSMGQGSLAFGGQGPSHVVSLEAQLHQASGEATFRGDARLWQQANSVAAPVIVLNRERQTLVARSTDTAEPVKVVLLSTGGPESGKDAGGKSTAPSVIRVRGGDLKYSDAEHKAVMHGGALGAVTAEAGTAISVSNEVELLLLPPDNHAGKDGGAARVDRMTARGRVTLNSEGRRGSGEQLVYSGESGEYVLTGTAAAPPRMNDPARGTVSGEALIFNSRDDSVSVEGGGRKTTTETTAPK